MTERPRLRARIVLLGALLVGTLDLAFAILYWRIGHDVPPIAILHSISAGLLGADAAAAGGAGTAVLGGGLHYVIATAMAFTYALVARGWPALVRSPTAFGAAYGVVLYLVMNLVVQPLSAKGMPSFANHAWVASSVAIHVVIGVIFAHTARRALR